MEGGRKNERFIVSSHADDREPEERDNLNELDESMEEIMEIVEGGL